MNPLAVQRDSFWEHRFEVGAASQKFFSGSMDDPFSHRHAGKERSRQDLGFQIQTVMPTLVPRRSRRLTEPSIAPKGLIFRPVPKRENPLCA
jgi:hypothetical protein